MIEQPNKPLILFDGVCRFCHASVNFVITHDKNKQFRFCAIQSATGQAIMKSFNILNSGLSSVILIQDGSVYRKSTAALRIAKQLAFPWTLLYPFVLLPGPIRDRIYDFIGQKRYHLVFGKFTGRYDCCLVPDESIKSRFIDSP